MSTNQTAEEREEIKQLGEQYLAFYDKRIYIINEDVLLSKADKRKQHRVLYTRTKRKFAKATGAKANPKTRKKRRTKKNLRTSYTTYEDFERAVKETLPPLITGDAMLTETFYVFPLRIFYEESVLPPEHFVNTYKKKFDEFPVNAILYTGQGMPLLALGAVPYRVGEV